MVQPKNFKEQELTAQDDFTKQAMLAAIVESSEDAIISKRLDGIITSWNQSACRIFGYTEEEAVGQSITMLIPPGRLNEEDEIIASLKKGQKIDHFQTVRLHKSGNPVDISLTISPIKNQLGEIIGASKIARDISEQVRSMALIQKYTENLETLNHIGRSISEKMDVEVVLQRVTDATTKLTGAAFGAFFYNSVNEEGNAYMLYTLSGAPRSAFQDFPMPRHTSVFSVSFDDKAVLRVDDITADPRYGKSAPYFGMPNGHLEVRSFFSVPVISNSGGVIGSLIFGHPDKGVFKEEHEAIICSIASQAAIAIDNSKLFEEVKSLSAKKDEFIALASHELKTPLTSVKGYLQLLAKRQSNETDLRFVEKSLSQLEKLNLLIDDMLDMSRIQAGKLAFNLENFDLKDLVADVADTFSHTTPTYKIDLQLPSQAVFINADHQRLEQAITNLVGNAIKYSPKQDRIEVSLTADGRNAKFSVKDYGIGLKPEQLNQLFSRFYRADGTKGISGLGLGLYLTKQIIERHGGEISVESEFGAGSCFSFSIPLR